MQFRFRMYDEENKTHQTITYADIEDYNTMFKTLTFMKEHECEFCLEVNEENFVEVEGTSYEIENVALCVGGLSAPSEDRLLPLFVVDVKEAY